MSPASIFCKTEELSKSLVTSPQQSAAITMIGRLKFSKAEFPSCKAINSQ